MDTEQKTPVAAGCNGCPKAPRWRTDFPIEWEGDHYVSRREMVKFLTLGSLLLAGANWVTALAGRLIHAKSYPEKMIGTVSSLEQQSSILFRYPTEEDPCIAVKTPAGEVVAYSQVCTHLSCAVVYSQPENQLLCPCHRGAFNVSEGVPVGGPPTRRLPRILLQERGDQLFATGVEV
jgi:Rieske Fe-S protein